MKIYHTSELCAFQTAALDLRQATHAQWPFSLYFDFICHSIDIDYSLKVQFVYLFTILYFYKTFQIISCITIPITITSIPSEISWKELECCTWYPFTFGGGPLQIMVGKRDVLFLQLRTPEADTHSRSIKLKFSTGEYYIKGCTAAMEKFSSMAANILPDTSTIWTIDLREDRLRILANSSEVQEVLFLNNSVCSNTWENKSLSIGEIKFSILDNASLRFRNLHSPRKFIRYLNNDDSVLH